jgi:hypothetical protein
MVQEICRAERPALRAVDSSPARTAACHFSEEITNA